MNDRRNEDVNRIASADVRWRPPSLLILWTGGSLMFTALYTIVIMATLDEPLHMAMVDATASVLPAAGLAVATRALLKYGVMPRAVPWQMGMNLALAMAFALTWYSLIVVLLALISGLRGHGFGITAFSRPAFVWQLFQGLMLYSTISAVCYAVRGGREAANLTIVAAPPLNRYLTRSGDEIVPIDVRNVVSITGAQDFSEVGMRDGSRHLVRMSLNEFVSKLDPQRFFRIHRSTIVNFDLLAKAEPAGGGRMLLHMVNGEMLTTSRAGSRKMRDLLV